MAVMKQLAIEMSTIESQSLTGAPIPVADGWHDIEWHKVTRNVKRLQTRIVKAIQEKRWGQVKALQRLLTRSFSGKALAVRRVTENQGKRTAGVDRVTWSTPESKRKAIESLRQRGYRAQPLRRVYIPKRNGKQRPLSMPVWSDKLLQEVIRLLLEAYYEPQFSQYSHGFRLGRGCHTALREIQTWGGVKWFIEGDIHACFDTIDFTVLLNIMREQIHDNRFIQLIENCLRAGYLEDWQYVDSYSGVPQGGVLSSCLSNLVLDKLDKFIGQTLIPANTKGHRRKTYPP